jgi:hypothetical protein
MTHSSRRVDGRMMVVEGDGRRGMIPLMFQRDGDIC